MIITWVHQYAMSICLMRCPFALCDAHLPNAMHAPEAAEALALPKEPLPVTHCVVSIDVYAQSFAETSMEITNQLT